MTTVVPLLARLLLTVIFVPAAISKATSWDGNASYMASRGIPLVPVALALSLVIEAAGSVCLVLGWRAREAAAMMAVYLVPVTLYCHDFMSTQFNKNLGIIGGLMMIAAYGPGRLTLGRPRG
jgi:putative oxidoreductase